jgi:hypothetical protein
MTRNDFIANIDQYCDRWCERCPLSSRCEFFVRVRQHRSGSGDSKPEASIALLTEIEQDSELADRVVRLFTAWLDRDVTVAEARRNAVERLPAEHPLYLRADVYSGEARKFLKVFEKAHRRQAEALVGLARTGLGDPNSFEEHLLATEASIVVAWYYPLIPMKILRAIAARMHADLVVGPVSQAMRRDADGSAKVAYLAVSESISALKCLRTLLPQLGSVLNRALRDATRLLEEIDTAFPGHWTFVRPGFDQFTRTE